LGQINLESQIEILCLTNQKKVKKRIAWMIVLVKAKPQK